MKSVKTSLKTKIVVFTGSVFVILLLLISITLLFQWRSIIIDKEIKSNFAVTKTFAVSAIDALIYQEQTELQKENLLETYVDNFINRIDNVKFVIIYDPAGTLILARERSIGNNFHSEFASVTRNMSKDDICSIYKHNQFGWIMEVSIPLSIGGKIWGFSRIAYNVEPIRSEIKNVFFLLLGSTVIITFLTLVVLYYFSYRLTISLNDLVNEIDRINIMGDLDSTDSNEMIIRASSQNDEIGFLFHRFNKMKKRIEKSKIELEIAQKQIYQAEKLASIGRLASGVAHQVNNPLNGIKSCIYAIQKEPENIKQTNEYLELINEGLNNIETVVQKLLGFARQEHNHKTKIDVNESIQKVINLLDYRLKDKMISLNLNFSSNIPLIEFDYFLFQEVIMNLLLNSFDAVSQNGKIDISTEIIEDRLIIEIKDDGIGIPEENLQKIFDPFFTTKEVGVGTGLGLSVCLNIIESYGGTISVSSIPEKETIFKVVIPIKGKNENINN